MSRCVKCTDQKKGCAWFGAKKIIKQGKKASGKTEVFVEVPTAASFAPATPSRPTPLKDQGTKRKRPDDHSEVLSIASASNKLDNAGVIYSRPRSRFPPRETPDSFVPPTTSFSSSSFADSFSPHPSAFSDLGPPPSTIGTSRSAPSFSSHSHTLEITLLRSELEAANALLRREKERSAQELESLREQFSRERSAYAAYIKTLKESLSAR